MKAGTPNCTSCHYILHHHLQFKKLNKMPGLLSNIVDATVKVIHCIMFQHLNMHLWKTVTKWQVHLQPFWDYWSIMMAVSGKNHLHNCSSCKLNSSTFYMEHHFYFTMTNQLWLFRLEDLVDNFSKKNKVSLLLQKNNKTKQQYLLLMIKCELSNEN